MNSTQALILGAGGQIGLLLVRSLQGDAAVHPTLFLRDAQKLSGIDTAGMSVIEGDVGDVAALNRAITGKDIVIASLAGDMEGHARHIISAMQAAGGRRLVFVTSLGIYDEVPGAFGRWNNDMIGEDLKPYRRAADLIEASGLDVTIVRPAWLTDEDTVDFETTTRTQPFRGTEVSRKSVAAYLRSLIQDPAKDIGGNTGLNKPGTDGDKPAFM